MDFIKGINHPPHSEADFKIPGRTSLTAEVWSFLFVGAVSRSH